MLKYFKSKGTRNSVSILKWFCHQFFSRTYASTLILIALPSIVLCSCPIDLEAEHILLFQGPSHPCTLKYTWPWVIWLYRLWEISLSPIQLVTTTHLLSRKQSKDRGSERYAFAVVNATHIFPQSKYSREADQTYLDIWLFHLPSSELGVIKGAHDSPCCPLAGLLAGRCTRECTFDGPSVRRSFRFAKFPPWDNAAIPGGGKKHDCCLPSLSSRPRPPPLFTLGEEQPPPLSKDLSQSNYKHCCSQAPHPALQPCSV